MYLYTYSSPIGIFNLVAYLCLYLFSGAVCFPTLIKDSFLPSHFPRLVDDLCLVYGIDIESWCMLVIYFYTSIARDTMTALVFYLLLLNPSI